MFKTVLFPVDQSRDSQDAAEKVAEIVKFCNSKLVILSVQAETEEMADTSAAASQVVDQLLQNAKIAFSDWGIVAETVKQKGKPAFASVISPMKSMPI